MAPKRLKVAYNELWSGWKPGPLTCMMRRWMSQLGFGGEVGVVLGPEDVAGVDVTVGAAGSGAVVGAGVCLGKGLGVLESAGAAERVVADVEAGATPGRGTCVCSIGWAGTAGRWRRAARLGSQGRRGGGAVAVVPSYWS